jgi:hypothetical protein
MMTIPRDDADDVSTRTAAVTVVRDAERTPTDRSLDASFASPTLARSLARDRPPTDTRGGRSRPLVE